ncbi:hypothetical protein M902_1826 [Bacteriovorax sp. BAL6_X]|uniref:hypothetical protein n=1 Tax=Bacteriovorax sp. BAL6_X TaxID=1201290 RepID=UPI0003856772|nr:hypothetical protein [Bacteriovorax sp. BAL6_X]EPZ51729.1 hypothetical protein M902_1826 [Bacteriovorax sp. BAL6_X]
MVSDDDFFIDSLLDCIDENINESIVCLDGEGFFSVASLINKELNSGGLDWDEVPKRFLDLYYSYVMDRDPAYWEHCHLIVGEGLNYAFNYMQDIYFNP